MSNGANGPKLELWLVRHGETEWSLDGRHTSVTDIPLTERGRERARELKDYLAGKKFAGVFVSPMQRAKETCEIAGYGNVAIVDQNLMEWNYGESEGKTTAEMRAKYGPEWSVWTNEIVGGESVEQVGERADKVIERALVVGGDWAGCGQVPPGGAVCARAYIADSGGAVGRAAGGGWEDVCAGYGQPERAGV